jgi:hypothetical protein
MDLERCYQISLPLKRMEKVSEKETSNEKKQFEIKLNERGKSSYCTVKQYHKGCMRKLPKGWFFQCVLGVTV